MTETERIVALDLNDVSEGDRQELSQFLTRPGSKAKLRETQIDALVRICRNRGGLIAAGVGHGKFLISALSPTICFSLRALLLVPASLVEQTRIEIERWRRDFRIISNDKLFVMSYSSLSTASGRFVLRDYKPDLIVADECHKLRRRESARTKRVIEYFKNNPTARFVGLSGTLTARSLSDFDHLSELALRENSPLPRTWRSMRSWSRLIDVRPDEKPGPADYREMKPLFDWAKDDRPREAFRKRFVSCPGILATTSSSFEGSLEIFSHQYEAPDEIRRALRKLDEEWRTPDGRDLESPLDVARIRKQLSAGYWLRWDWPNGIVDFEWLEARNEFSREVRRFLKYNKRGIDSVYLAEQCENKPSYLQKAFDKWSRLKFIKPPPVVAEVISRKPLEFAFEIAKTRSRPSLIWSNSPKSLSFYRDELDIESYEAGRTIPLEDRGTRNIALSRQSFGTGLNLDGWSSNVLVGIPASAAGFEQQIGRTHRPGQREDSVEVHIVSPDCESTSKALSQLRRDAKYLESVSGQKTKVFLARWIAFRS